MLSGGKWCRFWAIYVLVGQSTGPVFAPYCSARLAVACFKARTASARAGTASERAPDGTLRVHVRVHAILGQNRKNTQRTGRPHVTIASQEVRTFHGQQTLMAPKVIRAGEHPWV